MQALMQAGLRLRLLGLVLLSAVLGAMGHVPAEATGAVKVALPMPVQPRFEIVVKGSVDAETLAYVRETVDRAMGYFTGGKPATRYEHRYVTVYGRDSAYSSPGYFVGRLSDSGGIDLYLASGCWDDLYSLCARTGIVHEVFHVLQSLAQTPTDDRLMWFDEEDHMRWFWEGAAEMAAAQAVSDWGEASYEMRSKDAKDVGATSPVLLQDLAGPAAWNYSEEQLLDSYYGLSFAAVERLAGPGNWQSTLRALPHVVRRGGTPLWDGAFITTFGTTLSSFYRDFENYHARGLTAP